MLDVDHLCTWIGRESRSEDLLTARVARGLWAVLDRETAVEMGAAAPPLVHWCLAPESAPMARIGADGHPQRGDFLPPVALPRRMWAGGALTFHDPLQVGDRIVRTSRIADVTVKRGRSGPLCFVSVDHRIETDRGVAIEERQDIVYRGEDTAPAPSSAPPPLPPTDETRPIEAGAVLLFRYSALTFNGHRIHYDRDYATGVEGYPGLVVHGPLQATLLLDFAVTRRNGQSPARFSFRATGAMRDGPLTLGAADGERATAMFTADPAGRIGMNARVEW